VRQQVYSTIAHDDVEALGEVFPDWAVTLSCSATARTVKARDLRVKASYAYRKGELKEKDSAQILGDLVKIIPKSQ
jgi:hypothetical protein